MKIDFQGMDTPTLHKNLITLTQCLELMHNGVFPGAAYKHLTNSITYIDTLRNRAMEEFMKRPDAPELAPEAFNKQPQKDDNSGLQGIHGAQ